jgi:hypothetical protein
MPRLTIIKAFKVFRTFLFKILALTLSFFEGFTILLVYGVGISPFLLLEIAVFSRVFLLFSAKIIIQATGYIDQVFLNILRTPI